MCLRGLQGFCIPHFSRLLGAISVNTIATTFAEGTSETLAVTFTPANATNKTVTWTSSDETKATVANGVVTAVAAGTTTITATASGKTATCAVTVVTVEQLEALVAAYRNAITGGDAAEFVSLLDANELGLILTNYAELDATGKTDVGEAMLDEGMFEDKSAVQSAITTAIAAAKIDSDARAAEAALVQAYTDAANAAAFVTLLDANALTLTLTDYEGLDATGKTAVGTAMLAVDTFANKAAVQAAVTPAIAAAKIDSDARAAEARIALAAAKVTAKGDLTTALATYTETDYTAENWITLTGFKTAGDTAIDAAVDLPAVETARKAARRAINAVETTAETNAVLIERSIAPTRLDSTNTDQVYTFSNKTLTISGPLNTIPNVANNVGVVAQWVGINIVKPREEIVASGTLTLITKEEGMAAIKQKVPYNDLDDPFLYYLGAREGGRTQTFTIWWNETTKETLVITYVNTIS